MRDPLDHLIAIAVRRWFTEMTVDSRRAVRAWYRAVRDMGADRVIAHRQAAVLAQDLAGRTTASSSLFSGGTR